MMEVLFCTTDNYPHHGGKSTHINDLTNGLKKQGIDYQIVDRNQINNYLYKFIKVILQPIKLISFKHYIYYRKKLELVLYKHKIKQKMKNNQFSVISAQDADACTVLGRLGIQIPIVLTMHTYIGIELTLDNPYFKKGDPLFENLYEFEKESLTYANSIITVDERIKEHILHIVKNNDSNIRPRRVTAISNFTDTDKHNIIDSKIKSKIRNENNIKGNEFVISCARRLVEKNGVLNLVKAIKLIEDQNVICFIAGDGPQMTIIKQYIVKNNLGDKIKLLGSLDSEELLKIYALSDLSVVPSITINGLQEATSISAIESMACGLPTIASDIGGLKQLIKNNETGILVEENNPKEIAKAIVEVMSNRKLHADLVKNSRDFIVSNHSHISSSEKYALEFKKAIKN